MDRMGLGRRTDGNKENEVKAHVTSPSILSVSSCSKKPNNHPSFFKIRGVIGRRIPPFPSDRTFLAVGHEQTEPGKTTEHALEKIADETLYNEMTA